MFGGRVDTLGGGQDIKIGRGDTVGGKQDVVDGRVDVVETGVDVKKRQGGKMLYLKINIK